jgi:hypothetical protein
MGEQTPRWSAEQVLALASDASAQKAGRALATPRPWRETGASTELATVWGLCQGSGQAPYQTVVDLTEPAFRCSCPSRKFPCKHALGLLLLWSAGGVADARPPDWVNDWLSARGERAQRAARPRAERQADPRTAQRRAERVDAGLRELDRWLTDQVRQGLAGASRAGYGHWDTMAARLVDAQAPAVASAVRRLAGATVAPDRLLAELGLIHLLVAGYRRLAELPPELAATVRSRIGFPVATEDVFARDPVRDRWAVLGLRDEGDERLIVRRVWLRGTSTRRAALVLSFAPPGAALPSDLIPGTVVDADLVFYPGALPLRALVQQRHGDPEPWSPGPPAPGSAQPGSSSGQTEPAAGDTMTQALDDYAAAVAAEPWLERWPVLLAAVVPTTDPGGRWWLREVGGDALPVDPLAGSVWPLVAAAGGLPLTVAGELTLAGIRPLSAWPDERLVRL